MDVVNRLFEAVREYFQKIPPGKRAAFAVIFVGFVALTSALIFWAFRPQYRILYSDLSLEDSGQIVEILKEDNIPFRLEMEGTRILVPGAKLYDVRIKVATKELPRDRSTGWELFDQTSLGVTDFVQKLNYHRGLEGEITRTILQLDPVEAVRVHLTIPEESLFRENQQLPMASITVRVNKQKPLSSRQVEGITYLVSSAVEGLEPENVTIVDSRGLVLSEKVESNPVMRLSASQLEIQKQVEADLISKGQRLLDMRFGRGRSALQVTAELDFQQRETTRELYDAENPSIRSEEITSSSSSLADTSSSRNENTITNYELNLTREHQVTPVGGLKRLSIAVMVDGVYETTTDSETKEVQRQFVALQANELSELERTIKSALGFSQNRGDEITVVSVPFQEVNLLGMEDLGKDKWQDVMKYGQRIMTLIAIVLMLLMVRNFLKRAQEASMAVEMERETPPQLGPGVEKEEEIVPIDFDIEVNEEVRRAQGRNEMITSFIAESPEMAARLIRSWLIEEKSITRM